jgi:hypothetical protein
VLRAHLNVVVIRPDICSCSLLQEVLPDSDYDAEEGQNSRDDAKDDGCRAGF